MNDMSYPALTSASPNVQGCKDADTLICVCRYTVLVMAALSPLTRGSSRCHLSHSGHIEVGDLIHRMDSLKHHISSINALRRLSPHDAVKSNLQMYHSIFREIDWDAQHVALSDISALTFSYRQQRLADFWTRLPSLIKQAKQAGTNAAKAAESVGRAAAKFQTLAEGVHADLAEQEQAAMHHTHWKGRDEGTARGFKIAGHALGPLTLGLGYLLWIGSDTFDRNAEDHHQHLLVLQEVSNVLQSKVLPVVEEAGKVVTAAAAFFDDLVIVLGHIQRSGHQASSAPASELHLHFEDMGSFMADLRTSVNGLLTASKQSVRQLRLEE